MPKTGFIGMIASYFACVNIRIHTFTGQIWITMTPFMKFFFKYIDLATYKFSTATLVDSKHQINFLHNNLKFEYNKMNLLNHGGLTGVDLDKFKINDNYRKQIRNTYNIPSDNFVFIFVGRLNKDKGIKDLLSAYAKFNIHKNSEKFNLIIIGDDEENIQSLINSHPFKLSIRYIKFSNEVNKFLNASDVFCLPSYREGFGNVILEASSSSLPVIATNIYGLDDVLIDKYSGLKIQPGDINDLFNKMNLLYNNINIRKNLGHNGRKHANKFFSNKDIQIAFINLYKKLKII